MDSLSAFEGAGWGHVSHSLYATVRSGPGPSTPTSLFLKTCRETIQAGPARERVALATRQDSRDLGSSGFRCSVSETRCNGGAFRDRSSPASGPGHPSQMGGVRRRAKQCFATRLPHPWPLLVWPSLAKQLPPGTTIAPLTWQRNRHGSERPPGPFYKSSFAEWFSASDAPEHRNLTPERVCVRPFRDPGEQDVRQGAYRDVFTAFEVVK